MLPANTDAWAHKNTREKRMFIGNRLRRMNWYERFQTAFNKKSHRKGQWPWKWVDLNDTYKQKFIEWWAQHEDNSCKAEEKDWAVKNFVLELPAPEEQNSRQLKRHRLKQLLLTYNGEWGNLAESGNVPRCRDMDELAAVLEKTASVQQLWEQIKEQGAAVCNRVGAEHHAVCLEICPRTLQEGALRVHVHLALVSSSAALDLTLKKGISSAVVESSGRLHPQKKAGRDSIPRCTT